MAALDEHPPFSVRDDSDDGPPMLAVEGELDLSVADELVSAIERVAKPSDSLCLDLGACGFVDSTGLKVLVQAARQFRAAGGELSVTNVQGDVARLFEITGLLLEGSALVHRPELG